MKRIYVLLLLLMFPMLVMAQEFDITLKGLGKSTWLLNENITIQGETQDYDSGWGHNYGLGFSLWLTENLGVGADVLTGRFTGDYIGTIDGVTYNSEVELKMFDLPLYLLLRSRNGFYFEAGPHLAFITDARYTSEDASGTQADHSVDSEYPGFNLAAMAGFGFTYGVSDRFGVQLGFRFVYGITDLKGVDALGRSLSDSSIYPNYETTSLAMGALQLGLAYRIGR